MMPQANPSASVSNGTRLKKRMRASEAEDELSNATHSEKYSFDDGNIILHVQNTLFRVHRGVLARHSTALNEMFPLPKRDEKIQPGTMLEGCQVVHLRDDKAEDWERMFAVIYDRDRSYKTREKRSVEILVSLLHLGKRYRFDGIFAEVMERLRLTLPRTMDKWAGLPKEFLDNMPALYRLTKTVLETGKQRILPALFLFCSMYTEGTTGIFQVSKKTGLPSSTVQTLVIGREKIIAACVEVQFTWVFATSTKPFQLTCQQPMVCQLAKQKYMQRFITALRPRNAFISGSEILKDHRLANICKECKADIIATQEANRKVLWDKMPSFFDLPPWANLQDP